MLASGAEGAERNSAFIVQLIRETGVRAESLAPTSARNQEIHLYAGIHEL